MFTNGKKRLTWVVAALFLTFFAVSELSGMPWSTDMFRQPAIQPYQAPKGYIEPLPMPPDSIATDALARPMARKDYEAMTRNPVALTPEALAEGEFLYATYCFVCHGTAGLGDGPVIKKGFYPLNLTNPAVLARTDGYIFSYIRYGGLVMMPPYREFVSSDEAWKIVGYVRKLQGK